MYKVYMYTGEVTFETISTPISHPRFSARRHGLFLPPGRLRLSVGDPPPDSGVSFVSHGLFNGRAVLFGRSAECRAVPPDQKVLPPFRPRRRWKIFFNSCRRRSNDAIAGFADEHRLSSCGRLCFLGSSVPPVLDVLTPCHSMGCIISSLLFGLFEIGALRIGEVG